MTMTIHIPDELARRLEAIASAQQKSLEQLAVERLMDLVEQPTSPESVVQRIRAIRLPSQSAVDDLDAAIAAGRLPVRDQGAFDQ
jgi:predicted transcriptional regulator